MSILSSLFPQRALPAVVKQRNDDATYQQMVQMARDSYADAAANIKSAFMSQVGSENIPAATDRALSEMYSRSVATYACVNYIATNVGLVEFEVVNQKGTRVETPMQLLFETDFKNIMRRNSSSLSLKGASLSKIKRTDGFPTSLRYINFNLWQRKFWGEGQRLRGFTLSRNQDNLDLPAELAVTDSFYITGFDPLDDYDGVAPAEASFLHAGVPVEIATTQLSFFENRAVPGIHFQPTQDQNWIPQQDDRDDLVMKLRRLFKGSSNAGRALVTPTRWEVKQYQAEFDTLDMDKLHDQADSQVFLAFLLPKELLMPSSSGYAQAYEARRGWLETYLKPLAEFFADQFTTQIVRPYNLKWKVVPKFDKVPGFRLDIAQRTTSTKDALHSTMITLYDAVKQVGVSEPPDSFKGIYMINGKPIPEAEIPLMYEKEQARADMKMQQPPRMGGRDGGRDVPPPTKRKEPRPMQGENPLGKQPERPTSSGSKEAKSDYLTDAEYKEFNNWRAIAGKGRDFEVRDLPADTGAFGKFLLTSGMDIDEAFTRIRTDVSEAKNFITTATGYRRALYGLVTDAFSEKIDRKSFGDLGRAEVSQAFRSAFFDGLREGGNEVDDLEEEDAALLALETKSERAYFTGFANDIYKTAIPLLKQAKAARDAGQPEADDLFQQFNDKREQMITRLDKWVNALRDINAKGLIAANQNQMLEWVVGETDHCETCLTANGQVHTARKWKKKGLNPGQGNLYCTGINCECDFKPVKGKEKGDINAIPMHEDMDA